MSRRIFGIDFTPLTAEQIVTAVTSDEPPDRCRLVVTANLDHVAQLATNARFRAAYDAAWIATVDGTPVHVYGRLRGIAARRRVTGADLMPLILRGLRPGMDRPYFVGATPAVVVRLTLQMMALGFSSADIGSTVPRHGFEQNDDASMALAVDIAEHGATHVFMGIGAPKSEIWAHEHSHLLGAAYVFCFGAGLDYAAGTRRRAPRLLQAIGMEWAWRVVSEPSRLFMRYFVRSWGFLFAVAADLLVPSPRR